MATETVSQPTGSAQAAPRTTFQVGTRKSKLALEQANIAISYLQRANPTLSFTIHSRETMGDKNQVTALHQFNAKSLWTSELEAELMAGATDLIVHSLKDMPTQLPFGCALGVAINREEKRDCVVMSKVNAEKGLRTLADLPDGSTVGTSSVRRLSQLRRLYPRLRTEDVRGNVGTRLGKLDAEDGKFAALILAATGLQRVGEGVRVSSFLSRKEGDWLGPVGQGAIGVEIRGEDQVVRGLCQDMMKAEEEEEGASWPKEGKKVLWECLAERMLLRTLEGGCSVPIGVETEWQGEELVAYARVASVDGQKQVDADMKRAVKSTEEAEMFGLDLAKEMLQKGADKILDEITLNRKIVENSGNA